MLDGFDHVTIAVRDVVAAGMLYETLLGTPPVWQGEHVELGTRAILFGTDNGLVELVGPHAHDDRDAGLRALLDTQGEGLIALAFAAAHVERCREALRARGLRVAPPEDGEARSSIDGSVRRYRSVELSSKQTRGLGVLVVERPDRDALTVSGQRAAGDVHAIDHVVVRTSDPDAAIALYRDGLGIRLALDRAMNGSRMLFFRVGEVTLEVVQAPDPAGRDALWGIAYRVLDIEAAHQRLKEAGFSVSDVRKGAKSGTRVFTVRNRSSGVPTLLIHDPARIRPSPG